LYDAQQNHLIVHVSVNMDYDYAGVRLALGEGAMGKAALTRQPVVVCDYRAWSERSLQCEAESTANVLAVPLLAGDELIGAMSAGDGDLKRIFTADDIRLLSMFAQQATVAIKNARLFEEVQYLAITDPLTGLYNRRYFLSAARRELERAHRHHSPLVVIIADLDDFKRINDDFGHPVGDRALRAFSDLLRRELRSIDLVARYGGEEFILLLPETDENGGVQVVERVRLLWSQTTIATGQGVARMTSSFGMAVYAEPFDGMSIDTLVARADEALLCAKQAGKNRLEIWQLQVEGGR
jgi:diguanylate cyclase (GGDEF)-like protein